MAGPRERFRDGAGILGTYSFEVNHSEEEGAEQNRNITRQALASPSVGGPKFVLQQGESTPAVLRFTGSILSQSQLTAMQAYFDACNTRTIFFRDVSGVEYEVLITRFSPQRKRVAFNSRAPTQPWYWTYQLDMEVIR